MLNPNGYIQQRTWVRFRTNNTAIYNMSSVPVQSKDSELHYDSGKYMLELCEPYGRVKNFPNSDIFIHI